MAPQRRRTVHTQLRAEDRRCLYCLTGEGAFKSAEHVVPRALGPETDRYVIPPGGVCDACNGWLGRQVDAPFIDRFDMQLTRGLEDRRGRSGSRPLEIMGRDATAKLTVDIDGAPVIIYAARADETDDGGLDIEVRPQHRDPPDIVTRTLRALWKMALGCMWLQRPAEALHARWDPLRCGVLGGTVRGYVLQAPFIALATRQVDIAVNAANPATPTAMRFTMGGVQLAAPLAQGAPVSRATARQAGWELHRTDGPVPTKLLFRLETDGT